MAGNLWVGRSHYNDVIMSAMTSQITNLTIVYPTVYSWANQRKHESSASLVRGIHQWPVNSPHKRPVTRNMFPFDDVMMCRLIRRSVGHLGNGWSNKRTARKDKTPVTPRRRHYIFACSDRPRQIHFHWQQEIVWGQQHFQFLWPLLLRNLTRD